MSTSLRRIGGGSFRSAPSLPRSGGSYRGGYGGGLYGGGGIGGSSDRDRLTGRRMKARNLSAEGSRYREDLERLMGRLDGVETTGGDPAEVAEAAYRALFEDNPKRRYMVVPNERQAEITIRKAIEEMVQLNQAQKYRYDRDRLVQMLGEIMAENP